MIGTQLRRISGSLTAVAIVATLLSLLPVRSWPLEILASFRIQILTVCLFAMGTALLLRVRYQVVIGITLIALHTGALYPMFVRADRDTDPIDTGSIEVLTLNLEWTNRSSDEILETIAGIDADIVTVQEVDIWWRMKLATLIDQYPFQSFDPLSTKPGVAVLAKKQATEEKWIPLHGRPYVSLLFEDDEGREFRFAAIHTLPPRSPLLYRARNRQIDDAALQLSHEWIPTIMAGDFNTTPWSPVLSQFQATTSYISVRTGRGTFPTWPSWNPMLRVPIDHIFHSPEFRVDRVNRVPLFHSDHIGLVARLSLGSVPAS